MHLIESELTGVCGPPCDGVDGGHDCGGDAAVAAADGGQHAAAPEPADVEHQAEGQGSSDSKMAAKLSSYILKETSYYKFLAAVFAVMQFKPLLRVT